MNKTSNIENNREKWCDIVKGFAILAVVFGHLSIPDTNNYFPIKVLFAYLWHVPVFFVVAGFYLTENKFASSQKFLRSRFYSLFLPTLLFAIGAIVCHNFLVSNSLYPVPYALYSSPEIIAALSKSLLLIFDEPIVGALWFASLLWYASLALLGLHHLLRKIVKDEVKRQLVQTILLLINCIFFHILSAKYNINIFFTNKVATALWLMQCGILLRQYINVKFTSRKVFLLSLVSCYISAIIFGGVYLDKNEYFSIFTMTPTILAALYVLCYIGKKLQDTLVGKIVANIGVNSFYIMALHLFAFKITEILLNHLGYCSNVSAICPRADTLLLVLLYLILGVSIPMLLVIVFNKIKHIIR